MFIKCKFRTQNCNGALNTPPRKWKFCAHKMENFPKATESPLFRTRSDNSSLSHSNRNSASNPTMEESWRDCLEANLSYLGSSSYPCLKFGQALKGLLRKCPQHAFKFKKIPLTLNVINRRSRRSVKITFPKIDKKK